MAGVAFTQQRGSMLVAACVLVLAATAAVQGEAAGPQLWRVGASPHHQALRFLEDKGHIDIWGGTGSYAQVMVEAEAVERVEMELLKAGVEHRVEVEDALSLVQRNTPHVRSKRAIIRQMDWNNYHDFNTIEAYISTLNATRSDVLQEVVVARTYEGRPVRVVVITDPTVTTPKKKIWIEGGIHAREWISPAVTTFLIHRLVNDWRSLLRDTEWYIVPVANPDGYQFSFGDDLRSRLWRKNRRINDDQCMGVDLNRNWDLKWGVGASENTCSETYRGPSAFSEPETMGLQRMMREVGDIDLFITFHSFGQTVLYPWGWTIQPPSNVRMLKRVAKKFADMVKQESNGSTAYQIGGSGPLYGLASGATDDWAYGELGTPLSYTIELPDKGNYGFLLPKEFISGTVTEAAKGVYCMASFIANTGPCAPRRSRNPWWGFRRQPQRIVWV